MEPNEEFKPAIPVDPVAQYAADNLDDIINQCENSDGFIIFVGVLSDKVNEKDERQINFIYRRDHFSFEDAKEAIKAFQKHLINDFIHDMPDEKS